MIASPVQPNVNKNTPASLAFLGLPEPSWTFWASLGLPGPSWAFLGFPGTWTVRRKTHYVSVVVLVLVEKFKGRLLSTMLAPQVADDLSLRAALAEGTYDLSGPL